VGRDGNIRETDRVPISPRPPHSCGKYIGRLGDETLLQPS